jgi:hypothetical protein
MRQAGPAILVGAALLVTAAQAEAECTDGQVLEPGQSCVVSIVWGHDHWISAAFSAGAGHKVVFRHLEGDCNVALFGPEDAGLSGDDAMVGAARRSAESAVAGDYHLFTRALAAAQEACRFEISVN